MNRIELTLVLFILAACVLGFTDILPADSYAPPTTEAQCERSKSKDYCYKLLAVNKAQERYCERVGDKDMRNQCFLDVFRLTKNANLCKHIKSNTDFTAYCKALVTSDEILCSDIEQKHLRDQCLSSLAASANSAELCEKSTTQDAKERCYLSTATANANEEACKKINSSTIKESCLRSVYDELAVRSKSLSYCDQVQSYVRASGVAGNICYRKVINLLSSLPDCSMRPTVATKEFCYLHTAIKSTDPSLCSKINKQKFKDRCYNSIASKGKEASLCLNIKEETGRNKCFSDYSHAHNKTNACLKIDVAKDSGKCIRNIALKVKNPNLCHEISHEKERDLCFLYISDKIKVVDYCELITSNSYKSQCYFNRATKSNNHEDCLKIPSKGSKDRCVMSLAQSRGKEGRVLCESIEDKNSENFCLSMILNDESYCHKITAKERYYCLFNIASKKGDKSFCKGNDTCIMNINQRSLYHDLNGQSQSAAAPW